MIQILKAALAEDMENLWYYIVGVFQNLPSKAVCAVITFLGLQVSGFYGDEFMIVLLARLMVVDLVVGVWDAIRTERWAVKIFFFRGICKFPVYAMYIFFIACIDYGVEHALKTNVLFVEMFVAFLIAAEVYSIIKHMHYIGFKIPDPLLYFAFGFKKKLQKKLQTITDFGKKESKKEDEDL